MTHYLNDIAYAAGVLLVLGIGGLQPSFAQQPGVMYWYDAQTSNIHRSALDGSAASVLFEGPEAFGSIDDLIYDPHTEAFYATKRSYNGYGQILRLSKHGGSVDTLFRNPLGRLQNFSVHGGMVFFEHAGTIWKKAADEPLAAVPYLNTAASLAVDTIRHVLYHVDQTTETLYRRDLTTGTQHAIADPETGFESNGFLSLNSHTNELFWIDHEESRILRTSLDNPIFSSDLITEHYARPGIEPSFQHLYADAQTGWMYWTSKDGIFRIKPDSSDGHSDRIEEHVVVTLERDRPRSLIVASRQNTLFWFTENRNALHRSTLTGERLEDITFDAFESVLDIDWDAATEQIYWTSRYRGTIWHANTDGSQRDVAFDNPVVAPTRLAIDGPGNAIYWIDAWKRHIRRGALDGSESTLVGSTAAVPDLYTPRAAIAWAPQAENLWVLDRTAFMAFHHEQPVASPVLHEQSYLPVQAAVDEHAQKIYWTDRFSVMQANLDGTDATPIATRLVVPTGLALDTNAGKVYWTDTWGHKIQRANLDGSGIEDIMIGGRPQWLALDFAETLTSETLTSTDPLATPQTAVLHVANYPNPFVDQTTLTYTLPDAQPVHLVVYDLLGRERHTLDLPWQRAGTHTVRLDTDNWESGLYVYRLQTATSTVEGRMVRVR